MPLNKNMRVQTNLVVNKKRLQGLIISVEKRRNVDQEKGLSINPYLVYLDEPYFLTGKEEYYKFFGEDDLQELLE